MARSVLSVVFSLVLIGVNAQSINPLFWKNYSRENPSYVNTDATHYSDLWFGIRVLDEDFNSSTGFLTEIVSGVLHNYTLKNGKTNIGASAQYNQIGGLRLSDVKLRGSHQLGDFNIGLAAFFQRSRLVNISTDESPDPLVENIENVSRIGASLDFGANYSNNGWLIGASATGLLNLYSDDYFEDNRRLHLLLEKELTVSEIVKMTPFVSSELASGLNPLTKLGARMFFKEVLFVAYFHGVNAHHAISVGGNIKKKIQLGYGIAIPTNSGLRRNTTDFHQLNLSYIIN